MLQVSVNGDDGSLNIPLGSKLAIVYRNKTSGKQSIARIITGPAKHHFIALFEDDDVDFEIEMGNSSNDRKVRFRLEILKKIYGFMTHENSNWRIKTLESKGRKLHFIRQSGDKGKELISDTATNYGLSRHSAAVMLSAIKFNVAYSKPRKYFIGLKADNGRIIHLEVTCLSTVADLKEQMRHRHRLTCQPIITLKGRQLGDHESIESLSITTHSILDVTGPFTPIEVTVT